MQGSGILGGEETLTTEGARRSAHGEAAPRRRGAVVVSLLLSGVVTVGVAAATETQVRVGAGEGGSGVAEGPVDRDGWRLLPGSIPIADEPPPGPAPDEAPPDELPPAVPPDGDLPPAEDEPEPEGAAPGPLTQVSGDAQAVDIVARDARLGDLIAQLSRVSGVNAVAAPWIGVAVNVSLLQIPPREAVEVLARMSRCEVEALPGGVLLVTNPPKVDLELTEANGALAFQLLAAQSRRDILVDRRIMGSVNVSFSGTPWREALRTVVSALGAHLAWRGDVALVTATPLPTGALGLAPSDELRIHTRGGETHVGKLVEEARGQLTIERTGPGSRRVFERKHVLAIEPVWRHTPSRPAGGPEWHERRVDLDVTNAFLETACDQIGGQLGVPLLADPALISPSLSCSLRQVSGRAAVEVLARNSGGSVEERDVFLILSQPYEVSVQATDCPLPAFYRLLAGAAGGEVVVGPDVDGTIDAELKKVPPLDALGAAALVSGHRVSRSDGNTLSIRRATWAAAWHLPVLEPAGVGSSAPPKAAPDVPPAESDAARAKRIEALFATIERQAQAREDEALIESFTQLRQLVSESPAASAQVWAGLERSSRALEGFDELSLSIELQLLINEANGHLRAMEEAIRAERFREVEDHFAEVEALATRVKVYGGEAFYKDGNGLLERARGLAARARELEPLSKLPPLEVLAILRFGPNSPSRDAAVVNGWVVHEGDAPRDAQGEPLETTKVIAIEPGLIRFRVDGADVVCRLASPR